MATALSSLITQAGQGRRRDDRRDHADRPGASDRRAEGEVACSSAGRDQADHRPGAQSRATSRRSRTTSAKASSSSSSTPWRGRSRRRCRLPIAGICSAATRSTRNRTQTDEEILAMAAKSTRADKARQAAQSAGSNPYVRRLIEDQELRNSVKDAFASARYAYQRMSNGKGPVRAVTEDKKVAARPPHAPPSRCATRPTASAARPRSAAGAGCCHRAGRRRLAIALSEDLRRRSSTGCSAPRRSSSTPRRRRRRRSPQRTSSSGCRFTSSFRRSGMSSPSPTARPRSAPSTTPRTGFAATRSFRRMGARPAWSPFPTPC